MVICRYFQQGVCRFGDACRNEHVYNNINNQQYATYNRQYVLNKNTPSPAQPVSNPQTDIAVQIRLILADMTSSEKGNQWLLSCYGPIKGKPNFPNFEDHSFEEIRWMVYNARKQGNSDAVTQLYTRMVQEARQKFKFYQTTSRELVDTIKTVYAISDNTPKNAISTPPTFGQGNSIFSQAKNPLSNAESTQTNASIFGASNQFTTQPRIQQPSSNVFSGGNANQTFSFNTQPIATAAQPLNVFSMFGNNQNNTSATNVGVFGSNVSTNNTRSEPVNTFGTVSNNPIMQGMFNSNNTSQNQNVFGANPAINSPLAQQNNVVPNSNVFSANPTMNSPLAQQQSIFGSSNTPLTQPSIFGTNQQTSQNTFSPNQQQMSQTTNTFGSNQQITQNQNTFVSNQSIPQTHNTFGPNQQVPQNFFTSNQATNNPVAQNTNIFVTNQNNNPPPSFGNQQGGNIFLQKPSGSIFTTNNNPTLNSGQTQNANIFGINPNERLPSQVETTMPSNQQVPFGASTNTVNPQLVKANVKVKTELGNTYSKIEDLSETDLASFKSDRFKFGCIPIAPPPITLCH